jgi:sulfur carrier protein ThiS
VQVDLILFGHYARYLPEGSTGGSATLQVGPGATVTSVLDTVGLPSEARGYVTLNGRRAPPEEHLADGDEIRVVVPLGGG